MVKHIVFFKLKDNSEDSKKSVKKRLMSMEGKIPYLRHLEVGTNFNPQERAFDLVLITDFDSKEDLAHYAIHPIHLEIITFINSIEAETKVVDYIY